MPKKKPKTFFGQKVKAQLITSSVTWWFKKFHVSCKNLDDQTKSGRPKTVDSKAMLLGSWWVAIGEYSASPNPVWFIIFMTPAKTSRTAKYCRTFDSLLCIHSYIKLHWSYLLSSVKCQIKVVSPLFGIQCIKIKGIREEMVNQSTKCHSIIPTAWEIGNDNFLKW